MSGGNSIRDWAQNIFARLVIRLALLLPYETRLRLVGWVMRKIVAPIAGWNTRIKINIAHVMPDLPAEQVARIIDGVCDNVGRALIEIYSGKEFIDRVKDAPLVGPGVDALNSAREDHRPIVLLTAHHGNYDAVRGMLGSSGSPMAAVYRPMRNETFNKHYVQAISVVGEPVFPVGAKGVKGLVRHLKSGGIIGIVGDVATGPSPVLSFFGRRAMTPTSAAELALKYDAPLIPIFGVRQPDGVSFKIFVDNPIPKGDPEDMMQHYNDAVERVVRENMDQWFWIHRRWKSLKYGPKVME